MNLGSAICKGVNPRTWLIVRFAHSESETFGKLNRGGRPENMSIRSHIRNMPISQWKLIYHLKNYLARASGENGALFMLNKEWVALLQKLPTIYEQVETNVDSGQKRNVDRISSAAVKPFKQRDVMQAPQDISTPANVTKDPALNAVTEAGQPYTLGLPQVLGGLGFTFKNKEKEVPTEEVPPQWKAKKEIISKTSISSRLTHIIFSIANAESTPSKLQRLGDLIEHINKYPESKHHAVKEGAIRVLLHLRHETEDEAVFPILREAFAMLGHIEPLPGRGIRILSIDGGGIRGVLAIEMMKKLEEVTGKKIYQLFDYICGVSTGAILAGSVGVHKKNLDAVSVMYKELSTKIFTQNSFWGTSNLVWTHAYYDTEMWEDLLKKNLGDIPLIQTSRDPEIPKICAVSTVVNKAKVMAFLFRNYSFPYRVQSQYMGSHQYSAWEAARASAAAPLYFEEFKLGDLLHQDGGILVNNPTAVAIHEARQLWPTSPIQCIVSLGTGRFNPAHTGSYPEEASNTNMSSWKTKFMKILDSATDTEAVHTMLNDLMPASIYHRFNPYITEMVNMDEISPAKITQLELDAAMYFRRNEDKFEEIAKALLAERTVIQHAQDWIYLQREILGIN